MSQQKLFHHYTFAELDRELIARGGQKIKQHPIPWDNPEGTPEGNKIMERIKTLYQSASTPDAAFAAFSDDQLVNRLRELARGQIKADTADNRKRGIIAEDDRMDFFELEEAVLAAASPIKENSLGMGESKNRPQENDPHEVLKMQTAIKNIHNIKRNLDTVAMICLKDSLSVDTHGVTLNVKGYKRVFNLCDCERFSTQPIINGKVCTCFLVSDDVVATAGHFLEECKRVQDFRVVFGYKMENFSTPVTQVPVENVYRGVEFIEINGGKVKNAQDWGLLRLDRKVVGQEIVNISTHGIVQGQSVYTIGFPVGLPLKFAAGARVFETRHNVNFSADLDVFMGNSGSPVFDMTTHDLIGMAVKGFAQDFRLVKDCWISLIYPTPDQNTPLSQCTRSSVFRNRVEIERARVS